MREKKRGNRPDGIPPTNMRELGPVYAVDEINVVEWCPGDNAVMPAEQVHILCGIVGVDAHLAIRLKSRRAAEELIAALRVHTDGVWPVQ